MAFLISVNSGPIHLGFFKQGIDPKGYFIIYVFSRSKNKILWTRLGRKLMGVKIKPWTDISQHFTKEGQGNGLQFQDPEGPKKAHQKHVHHIYWGDMDQ